MCTYYNKHKQKVLKNIDKLYRVMMMYCTSINFDDKKNITTKIKKGKTIKRDAVHFFFNVQAPCWYCLHLSTSSTLMMS